MTRRSSVLDRYFAKKREMNTSLLRIARETRR
jgi:hypothetical protein